MSFNFQVPRNDGSTLDISLLPGESAIFVGANGGGKTRLAAYIETRLAEKAHRISAHRALSLNPTVQKISERQALSGLRTGNIDTNTSNVAEFLNQRNWGRWSQKFATQLLDDYDHLVQALFAEQTNRALTTHAQVRSGNQTVAEPTKFEKLDAIWKRLLPHRELHISGDDIQVSIPGLMTVDRYSASEMSDGERAIFYMIGQTLVAAENSLLIIDEPELHIHRSIMSKLWDELESIRHDCAFVFITHDLEFAAARSAKKYVIKSHLMPTGWEIEDIPTDTGFDEETSTLILGSRRPILFVEGSGASLDTAIYRSCYPEWTVIPRGSCEEVIHSVVTMRANSALTRVTCAGIVDADGQSEEDIAYLRERGVTVLPVAEIENVFLLPAVSQAIAEHEGHTGSDLDNLLETLKHKVFETVRTDMLEAVITRHCKRRIDRQMKKIGLNASRSIAELAEEFSTATQAIDISVIAASMRSNLEAAQSNADLTPLLRHYDNKGLLAMLASHVRRSTRNAFEGWLTRVLRNQSIPALTEALRRVLPEVNAA